MNLLKIAWLLPEMSSIRPLPNQGYVRRQRKVHVRIKQRAYSRVDLYELLCFDIPLIALGQPAKLDGMG